MMKVFFNSIELADKDEIQELRRQNELSSIVQDDGVKVIKSLQGVLGKYLPVLRSMPALLDKSVIPDVDSALVAHTQSLIMRAMMLGARHGLEDKPKSTELADEVFNSDNYDWAKGVAFTHAVDFVKARIPISKKEWHELEPQVRFRACTVARLAQVDQIELVRKKVIKAIESGQSRDTFIAQLSKRDLVAKAGLDMPKPRYWETVYRTNLNTAYNAGRRMADNKFPRPFFYKFSANKDTRTTHICRNRHGVVKPANDPFWDANTPPLHFNCRSTLIPLYTRQQVTDDVSKLPKPAKGFGGDPLTKGSFWELTDSMKERAYKYGIDGEFAQLYAKVFEQTGVDVTSVFKANTLYSDKNGGYVKEALNRPENSKQLKGVRAIERELAVFVAKRGHRVALLPESTVPGMKNADAIIDSKRFEFKNMSSTSPRNIADRIRRAQKQADRVLVRVPDEVRLEVIFAKLTATNYAGIVWVLHNKQLHKWHIKK